MIIICISKSSFGQYIPVSTKQTDIYFFLNELNSEGIIDADMSVTPLSRKTISKYLLIADSSKSQLNRRQQKELEYYLSVYNAESGMISNNWMQLFKKSSRMAIKKPDFFYYQDSIFTFSFNPILGYDITSTNGTFNYKRKNGASAYGTLNNWSLWVNLRDNYSEIVTNKAGYLTRENGATFKGNEFEEINGGVAYSNKWATIALMKDNISWGQNLNGSNILSEKAPSFPMIMLQIKPAEWLSLNYIHAWLVSNVIDSASSFYHANGYRTVMHEKYLASNYITFRPWKKFRLSVGNSIVYSNIGLQPAYLIPVMFYKAVDHSLNGMNNYTGQNAQMFGSFSTTLIPHTTLYSSLYLDEISFARMNDKSSHSNFYSLKAGVQIHNFPLKNLSVCAEYTRTNPVTYNHFISTTTYSSNKYGLGHYLKDNSDEIWLAANYQFRRLDLSLSYCNSRHGNDYPYTGKDHSGLGLPFMDTVFWSNKTTRFEVATNLTESLKLNCGFAFSNIKDTKEIYTPTYLIGRKSTIFVGINYGF